MALPSPLQALSPTCEFLGSSPRVYLHHCLPPALPSQGKPDLPGTLAWFLNVLGFPPPCSPHNVHFISVLAHEFSAFQNSASTVEESPSLPALASTCY